MSHRKLGTITMDFWFSSAGHNSALWVMEALANSKKVFCGSLADRQARYKFLTQRLSHSDTMVSTVTSSSLLSIRISDLCHSTSGAWVLSPLLRLQSRVLVPNSLRAMSYPSIGKTAHLTIDCPDNCVSPCIHACTTVLKFHACSYFPNLSFTNSSGSHLPTIMRYISISSATMSSFTT